MTTVKVEDKPSFPTAVALAPPNSSAIGNTTPPPASDSDSVDNKPDVATPSPKKRGRPRKTAEGSVSPSKKPKKVKAEGADDEAASSGGGQTRREWTADEDAIYGAIIQNIVKENIWNAVKEDGRLAYRGSTGIKAHLVPFLKGTRKTG